VTDYLGVLTLVAARLDSARIPYMVSGSTALGFYAQPRMTRDIDVVIDVTQDDASRLVAVFGEDFYADEDAVRRAVAEQRIANVIHLASMVKIDLIVRKDEPFRRAEFDRRRQCRLETGTIWIVSPEDLVLSKLLWARSSGSELQIRDVRNLLSSLESLDWTYLGHWAERLGISASLEELRP
jgi:hypothetical protein